MNAESDLLTGVQAIADYMKIKRRRCQYMHEKKSLPTFMMSGMICARRSSIDQHLANLEAAARIDGTETSDV